MNVKRADEIIPWKVTDISLRPFDGFWSINPSIHFDGLLWRCVLRCTDYAMPGGVTIRSRKARGGVRTKNAMVIFDPQKWKAVELYKMRERDDLRRVSTDNVGYEDVRLFRTDRGGLQGIAASQHLERSSRPRNQLPEQVLLSFDDAYDIVDARPIRGGSWSDLPQKNWVPFDGCAEPRFLYAIDKGSMFDERGALHFSEALVSPSTRPQSRRSRDHEDREDRSIRKARERAQDNEAELRDRDEDAHDRRGRKSRDGQRPLDPAVEGNVACEGLRGGTQLVRVGDDAWLGIGHAMTFVEKFKYYWHVWYLVDSRGTVKSASPPMKLATNGIEFAAGMAIDGERVVVSFGVDDMECRLGETKLTAVLAMLKPV